MSKGGGSGGHRGKLEKSMTMPEFLSPQKRSPLPAAVVTFDAKGYIHSKKVNSYLIGGTLGEGSFAKVKEAYHEEVGEKVAIKIIDKKKAMQDPYVSKNFKREAKLLQKLNHPNIIQLFQVIETDNNYYLITELCSGGEVMKYIYKKQHLEEEETRKFVRQIVSAIDHLHRAGIIHRDLKVENLMLDDNNNVKLIDFGLSNEEVSVDELGNEIHCKTQCGSPAYAAPELLGQRDYNKAADIWSIGVNMYAMLTGNLPFTVEPFNITALHAKMLQNKMNPIPDWVSDSCRDLLQRMLVANPADRISMEDIFTHPWLNEGLKLPFIPHPYPSNIKPEEINDKIIEHMTEILDIGVPMGIKQDVITNKATAQYAVYCLLASRLARYEKEYSTKVTRTHDRRYGSRKKVSRDHGFFDDDESDASSTRTAPTVTGRKTVTSGGIPLRQKKGAVPRNRPVSDDVTNKALTLPPTYNNPGRRLSDILETDHRRSSMPEVELKKHLEQIQIRENSRKKDRSTSTGRKPVFSPSQKVRISVGTYPQGMSVTPPSVPPVCTGFSNHSNPLDNMSPPSDPCDFDIASHAHQGNVMSHTHHGSMTSHTRYTSPAGKRSLPRDLSKLGQTVAWGSNPPSRAGSRQSSLSSMPPIQKATSFSLDSDTDELDFHDVSSPTGLNDGKPSFFVETPPPYPNDDSLPNSTGLHLPSIDPKSHKKSPKRRNGTWTMPNNGDCTIRTQLQVGAVISEILRTAHGMNMKSEPQLANTVKCEYNSVTFEIGVRKISTTSCMLHFEWLSGGNHRQFNEVCGQVLQRVHL